MPSLSEKITKAERRIEQLKLQVQQQLPYIDCLRREHYDVKTERRALDAMVSELQLLQRYRLSLYGSGVRRGAAEEGVVRLCSSKPTRRSSAASTVCNSAHPNFGCVS